MKILEMMVMPQLVTNLLENKDLFVEENKGSCKIYFYRTPPLTIISI